MAKRSKSGLKHKRQDARRSEWNQAVRTELRTLSRKAPENKESLMAAIAALDRAARKGVIHKNAAARKKSRLTRKLGS
ncbi:MAG: 30S ribosomal protein S20 [bacterium]